MAPPPTRIVTRKSSSSDGMLIRAFLAPEVSNAEGILPTCGAEDEDAPPIVAPGGIERAAYQGGVPAGRYEKEVIEVGVRADPHCGQIVAVSAAGELQRGQSILSPPRMVTGCVMVPDDNQNELFHYVAL